MDIQQDNHTLTESSELDRVKTKLDGIMAEERVERAKHDKLLIAYIELTAKVSEAEARLDQILVKKQAIQAQATDLAKRNGKGKSK